MMAINDFIIIIIIIIIKTQWYIIIKNRAKETACKSKTMLFDKYKIIPSEFYNFSTQNIFLIY